MLDYLFPFLLLGIVLMQGLRFWQAYFKTRRDLDVDVIYVYCKLQTLRAKGVTDETLLNSPRRW